MVCVFYLGPQATYGFLQGSEVMKSYGGGQRFQNVLITHYMVWRAQQGVDNHHFGVCEFECFCGAAQA